MITGISQMSQMLAELDRMKGVASGTGATPSAPAGVHTDFSGVFKSAINHVNELQTQADSMARAFEMGDNKVDLTQVMVTMQKANLSFEGMLQVRNKFVDAYKEIMNMSI